MTHEKNVRVCASGQVYCLHLADNALPFSGQSWLLTTDPLMSIRNLCEPFQAISQLAFPRVVARVRTDSSHERTRVLCRGCVCTSPLAVNTTVDVLDLLTVPISSELDSF